MLRKNNSSGVITVFLTLVLIPLLAFGTLIMEAGRYISAKQVLAEAQVTASMSILADYNVFVQERFGLLAIDPAASGEVDHDVTFTNTLKYNADNNLSSSASGASKLVDIKDTVKFSTIYHLSEFSVLQRQVLEYAKYSVPYVIVSRALDIKGLVQELLDQLGLSNVLDLLNDMTSKTEDAVNKMDTAFKELGQYEYLTMSLQNLLGDSKTIDDYKTQDLYDEYVNQSFWIFGDNKAPETFSDSEKYSAKRKAFVDAVNNKANYMKNNPDPGPYAEKAKSNYNNFTYTSLSSSKVNLYLSQIAIYEFLNDSANAEKTISGNTSESVSYNVKTYTHTQGIDYSSVSEGNGTTKTHSVNLKTAVYNIAYDDLKSTSLANEEKSLVVDYASLDEFADSYGINYTKSENAKNQLKAYYSNINKKSELEERKDFLVDKKTEYDKKIQEYNTSISETQSAYKTAVNSAATKFQSQIDAIKEAKEALESAKEAFNATRENTTAESEGELNENSQKVSDNIDKILTFLSKVNSTASSGKTQVNTISGNLDNFTYENINQNSAVSTSNGIDSASIGGKTINIGLTNDKVKGYVNGDFSAIEEFCKTKPVDVDNVDYGEEGPEGSIDSGEINDGLDIGEIWDSVEQIFAVLNPIPSVSNDAYNVVIESGSQSKLKGLEDSKSNQSDKNYVDRILAKVGGTLGASYEGSLFDPSLELDTNHSDFAATMEALQGDLKSLKDSANEMKTLNVIKMLKALKKVLESLVSVTETILSLFGQLKSLFAGIMDQAYQAILINTYITQKFPSRMTNVQDAVVYPCSTGDEDTRQGPYFSGACVEYVMIGKFNEKSNQSGVFWILFGIRALVNCIQIALQDETMKLISACNMFAPLMFIAAVYLETNIDMNYLVCLGETVPIWKNDAHLSIKGLTRIAENLLEYVKNTDVQITTSGDGKRYHVIGCHTLSRSHSTETLSVKEATKRGFTPCKVCNPQDDCKVEDDSGDGEKAGYVDMDYDKYLWMLLFFVGGQKKLERASHLIQLETRYWEKLNKGQANFELINAGTYVRSEVEASYDSLLPMISLGENTNTFLDIYNMKYVGY